MNFTIYKKRLAALYVILIFMFTFTVFRLYVISESTAASEVLTGQYSRKLILSERDGFILDRNGLLLNAEKDGYICLVNPSACSSLRENAAQLSSLSGKLLSEVTEKMLRKLPFTLKLYEPLSRDGIYSYPLYKRISPTAPHIVGYTNKDGAGVAGIEKSCSVFLGENLSGCVTYSYNADALGVPLPYSGTILCDRGYSESSGVYLTLDRDFQLFCTQSAKKHMTMGAVCVSDINTGELLASVSIPDFDAQNIAQYLDSKNGELINRCGAAFSPGSVFKAVVAAAALEKDISLYDLEYECTGSYKAENDTAFSCHKKDGHGVITMKEAFAESCNSYFINLALETGIQRIITLSEKMGIGKVYNLDGVCTYSGNLDIPEKITEGFCANLAIGQGTLLVCPYQMLNIYSCAATGSYTPPFVVSKTIKGSATLKSKRSEKVQVLKKETTEKMREMMLECAENGLGKEAMPQSGDAGGKTATAQTGQYKNGKELLNSWFCGVFPLSEPKYAISVLCDGNGEKGNPRIIFREICEYLSDHRL